jgi:TM2 domain-containing membrane protein YozV
MSRKETSEDKQEISSKEPLEQKSWLVALLLSLFLGFCGADRFYIGRTRSAIVKLLIFGGFGVWWISDFVLIAGEYRKDAWGRPLKH